MDLKKFVNLDGLLYFRSKLDALFAAKQDTLVSGANIKTVNGQNLVGSGDVSVPVPVTSVAGRTGAVTLAKGDVNLDNVDNTSDANKPVSASQQLALDGKQDTLVSGASIKTVNGASLLGSGDMVISQAAAQVPADWNATSGAAQVLNKPTSLSSFSNDAGYQKAADVSGAISSAIAAAELGFIRYKGEVATKSGLPATASDGDLYYVTDRDSGYYWLAGAWQESNFDIDMTEYAKAADFVAVTNEEIDQIMAS